jgi:hypothetical protein
MEVTQFLLFDISNFESVVQRTQVVEPNQDTNNSINNSQSSSMLKRMSPARELQPGERTHPDYNQIIQIFEQVNDLTHENEFTDNFSREEWFSLLGSWQGVGDCIRAKCDYIERCESHRKDAITVEAWSQ